MNDHYMKEQLQAKSLMTSRGIFKRFLQLVFRERSGPTRRFNATETAYNNIEDHRIRYGTNMSMSFTCFIRAI